MQKKVYLCTKFREISMKKGLFLFLLMVFCAPLWAAYNLTASKVEISDETHQTPNYYFDITASTTSATYHVVLDVWPKTQSIVGSFSIEQGTITTAFSSLRKGSNTYYYFYEDCPVELTITKINEDTCELSAHFKAARGEDETRYEYQVAPFRFAYKAGDVPPEPEEDPYRFEPTQTVSQAFIGQIVDVRDNREKTGWINFNLVDSVNQKLDWIELDWVSDKFEMPVGTFTFSADSAKGTFIASPGYFNRNDYPSYVALRGEDWGQYTPYYIREGELTFSLNETGDTVYVKGTVTSRHGSTFTIDVTAYNEFYVAPFPPKPKEEKQLTMDSVVITCNKEVNGGYEYELNFSYREDYPNLIFNLLLPKQNELTEGTYRMTEDAVYAPLFFQNQMDFNDYFFYGINYIFEEITVILTNKGEGIWCYDVDMTTDVGSHYYFTLEQDPHLPGSPTALPAPYTSTPLLLSTKILENGQILIIRDGKRYSITNQTIVVNLW